jgi:hypothetical protein
MFRFLYITQATAEVAMTYKVNRTVFEGMDSKNPHNNISATINHAISTIFTFVILYSY